MLLCLLAVYVLGLQFVLPALRDDALAYQEKSMWLSPRIALARAADRGAAVCRVQALLSEIAADAQPNQAGRQKRELVAGAAPYVNTDTMMAHRLRLLSRKL